MVIVGALLALLACVLYGIATLLQAAGSRKAQDLKAFVQPLVLIGLVVDAGAFGISLIAYDHAPLFVVQSIISAQVVVAVLGAPLVLGAKLRPMDLVGVAVVVAGLLLVTAAAGEEHPQRPGAHFDFTVLALTVLLVALAAATYLKGPAWLIALWAGLGYGAVAIGTRLVDVDGGLLQLLTQPGTYIVALGGLVGVVGNVRALQRGSVALVAAVVSVVEVAVPSVVGVAVLGDTVRPGWTGGLVLAVAISLAGCAMLAASPAGQASGAG